MTAAAIAYDRFVAEMFLRYGRRAQKTWKKMLQVLREMEDLLPAQATTALIDYTLIERWAAARPDRTRQTAHSLLRSFRRAVRVAKKARWLADDPFLETAVAEFCAHLHPARRRKRHHRPETLARVAAHLREQSTGGWKEERLYVFFMLLLHTGLRTREALHLKVTDLDFDAGWIYLGGYNPFLADDEEFEEEAGDDREFKTPNSRNPVPMSDELIAELRTWAQLGRLNRATPTFLSSQYVFPANRGRGPWRGSTDSRPSAQLRLAGEAIGIKGLTPGSLRHSLRTNAAGLGIGPDAVMKVMRHTTLRTGAKHYLHASVTDRAAVARIAYLPPSERPTDLFPAARPASA